MEDLLIRSGRRSVGRHRTCDTSFTFRMTTGVAGDVSRAHPASIQPALNSPANPVPFYGFPVVVDTSNSGVRPIVSGDSALTAIWGVSCRPYPIQQATTGNNYGEVNYGNIAPPLLQPIDVLRVGYIMVSVPAGQTPAKGGAVFIWYAASSGAHVQGGFEASNTGGSTLALNGNYAFNGAADSNGIVELAIVV